MGLSPGTLPQVTFPQAFPQGNLPQIIQGGMGIGISSWRLARAVSATGQLGVVSGTALDQVLARRLQDGDPGGHMRHALANFPVPAMAARILGEFYIPGGRPARASYRALPLLEPEAGRESVELLIVANFAEVFLAREGHANPVGINYLEKLQIPHLPSIYGAMLAGVDYVLMGAGIPMRIPGVLDRLAPHQPAEYPFQVTGALEGEHHVLTFNPRDYIAEELPPLTRPRFLAIVASHTLALTLARKSNGRVDGFIIEGPVAGGHNAPPRGKLQLNESGEPVYGERDRVDLAKMREIGLPFWLAGGFATAVRREAALKEGAAGVQVGTAFAFCQESGLRDDLKQQTLAAQFNGGTAVFTDPCASPTGFPFKVVGLKGTAAEPEVYRARPRICDVGYLREAYRTESGEIGYRCPGEPVPLYTSKGGNPDQTEGRKCLCNGLLANIGLGQIRNGKHVEPALVTAGDDLAGILRYMPPGGGGYTASDVVKVILGQAS